jgi:[calcium/calmodulin-dependent protein kinase] kinase
VKLCDFGVSEMFDAKGDDLIKKAGGSPAFLSPESFDCERPESASEASADHAAKSEVHGTAVDIWALGMHTCPRRE